MLDILVFVSSPARLNDMPLPPIPKVVLVHVCCTSLPSYHAVPCVCHKLENQSVKVGRKQLTS